MAPRESRQDSYARAERAHRLRIVGRTWSEIAKAEGYRSRQAAQLAVRRHLTRELPESAEDQRRTASEGLRITRSVLFAALADAKQSGDPQATVAVSRAITDTIEKQARLLGLHVPVAQQVDVRVEQTSAAILDRAEADLLALAQQRPQQLPAPTIDAEVIEA